MTDRFGRRTPKWIRRSLLTGYIAVYALVLILGSIGISWPSHGMYAWQWILARIAGVLAVLAGLLCIASYVARRWAWEMVGTLVAGASLAGYVLIVSTVGPFSIQLLVVTLATVVVIGMYVRSMHLAARASRWADSRRAGQVHDALHGER